MGRLKIIATEALRELASAAAASPRRRKNLNLHESLDDPVQRFLNDFEPGTYVRPHRHAGKWELFVLLQGAAAVLTFDTDGRVTERAELNGDDGARVIEIPGTTWHTVIAHAPHTVLLEVKRGPYDATAAEFGAWSPAEGDPQAVEFGRWLVTAAPGDLAPR